MEQIILKIFTQAQHLRNGEINLQAYILVFTVKPISPMSSYLVCE